MIERADEEFERTVTLYQDMLFRFAYFRTGSTEDSEDIVQEVFLRMLDRHKDLSRIADMRSYLLRSIANTCCDYCKRRSKAPVPLNGSVSVPTDGNGEDWRDEYERIAKLLEEIPYEQAETMRMRCIDGLQFSEIADITGLPVATVKSRFRYGIDKMRALYRNKN